MPHRCMNCGEVYEDDSEELLEGCTCSSSLFMYEDEIGNEDIEQAKTAVETAVEDRSEKDDVTFKFDLDSIVVEQEGVYEINVSKLLEEVPIIVKRQEGSYHLHLPSAFNPKKTRFDKKELDE